MCDSHAWLNPLVSLGREDFKMTARLASRLARALGFTPSQDQIASALLGMPPLEARKELYRQAAAALAASARGVDSSRDPNIANKSEKSGVTRIKQIKRASPPTVVRPSQIPGAGAGLFSTVHRPRGGLVSLYAGVYTPPVPPVTPGADELNVVIPAPAPSEDAQVLAYIIHLSGVGGYLDGLEHATEARLASESRRCPGWGTAALANHPPSGVEPNVVAVDVEWAEAGSVQSVPDPRVTYNAHNSSSTSSTNFISANQIAQQNLNPLKSNTPWYIDGPTGEHVFVPPTVPTRGIAFLAVRAILQGEEIFFNYELSKDLPPWYAPVPAEVMWRILEQECGVEEDEDEACEG